MFGIEQNLCFNKKKQLMPKKKYRTKRNLSVLMNPRTKRRGRNQKERIPRRINRQMIAEAKKYGETATHVLYDLLCATSRKRKITLRTVQTIHRKHINCHQSVEYVLYQAMKMYNAQIGNPGRCRAVYRKSDKVIVFEEI